MKIQGLQELKNDLEGLKMKFFCLSQIIFSHFVLKEISKPCVPLYLQGFFLLKFRKGQLLGLFRYLSVQIRFFLSKIPLRF
jgi:hypothetical protein